MDSMGIFQGVRGLPEDFSGSQGIPWGLPRDSGNSLGIYEEVNGESLGIV